MVSSATGCIRYSQRHEDTFWTVQQAQGCDAFGSRTRRRGTMRQRCRARAGSGASGVEPEPVVEPESEPKLEPKSELQLPGAPHDSSKKSGVGAHDAVLLLVGQDIPR